MIDLSRSKLAPYDHQRIGVEKLVCDIDPATGRVIPGCFALFDEMGAGKSKQVVDAACSLYVSDYINRIIIVAPASVRTVWFDPELGEIKKHIWDDIPADIEEYHARVRRWHHESTHPIAAMPLQVTVTNYEFIRAKPRLDKLLQRCGPRTMLVLDESSAVKSHRAEQSKACMTLRKKCGRVVLLNGTPIANSPLDLYSQAAIMDPRILGCSSYFHFRARYAVMGGFLGKQILAWQNLEDLQKRLAPYVLRRLKSECLDLPEKLPPTTIFATLTGPTWKLYKDMRDQMIAWLDEQTVAVAPQAGVKALRLQQICSGFIGGLQDPNLTDTDVFIEPKDTNRPAWVPTLDLEDIDVHPGTPINRPVDQYTAVPVGTSEEELKKFLNDKLTREIGREKLDLFIEWIERRLEEDQNLKLLVWCRFRPEVWRLFETLTLGKVKTHNPLNVGLIWGGQRKEERQNSLRLLDPRTAPPGPAIVVGTPASGSMGLNLAAANQVIYVSNDFNLKTRLQSEDRVHRPGQLRPVSYTDVIATGPNGQKTIDHTIIAALRRKEDLAKWTVKAWLTALRSEDDPVGIS